MKLQKSKHQIKLEQWRVLIHECRNSGLTVKLWCEQNQINMQTYYRWQKKVWESGVQGATISASIVVMDKSIYALDVLCPAHILNTPNKHF